MTELELDGHDEGVAMTIVGRTMVVIWRGAPTAPRMRMLTKVTERMLSECPDGFYQLQVIEAGSTPPASEERKASAALLERMRGTARGIAFVIEGDGARSAIVRTILRAMSVISRGGVPKYFFAHVHEALSWLGPVMDLSAAQTKQLERSIAAARTVLSSAAGASALQEPRP
jgi:hypothetical protein